ncbi:MAG: C4-type zinc ribbon domain-containing protein, partial [Bacteroides sp.]|nr:C4-type zinc ribbon domain-containing protein [Bacteroides sp.]
AKKLEEKIEERLLQSYKRIRKNSRNGLGIVYVQRDACGGCFNKIPPQRQLDIRSRKKIIVCEYCGRVLIDPELAGVNLEEMQEETKGKKKRTTRKKK